MMMMMMDKRYLYSVCCRARYLAAMASSDREQLARRGILPDSSELVKLLSPLFCFRGRVGNSRPCVWPVSSNQLPVGKFPMQNSHPREPFSSACLTYYLTSLP